MCDHLKNFRNKMESSSYKLLHAFYVTCTWPGSSKKKTLKSSCNVCKKSGVGLRLHACLSCVFIGCINHFEGHEEKSQEKHKFAMDLFLGEIYCFKCKDYVYDENFSDIAKKLQPSGETKETITWLPSKEDRELFETNRPVKMNQTFVGLRGLYNLGLTCYINCIFQVFANTPMMRNYFLSGRHACRTENNDCQACLLSEIFQELYSGNEYPFSLHDFVYGLWKKNDVFCGRNPNDAHEFYEFYLNDLHMYCKDEDTEDMKEKSELPFQNHTEDSKDFSIDSQKRIPFNNQDSKPCRCVIHQIFSGKYQNVKICPICGVDSLTNSNSEWSINLHYGDSDDQSQRKPLEAKLTDCIKKCIQGTELRTSKKDNNGLDETVKIICPKCKTGILSEQLLIKVLPNILCFHFPREAESENEEGIIKKGKTRIIFPEYLDMAPYTPETVKSSTLTENGASKNIYVLYAIVCHKQKEEKKEKKEKKKKESKNKGNEGGHYYTYVRKSKNKWYECSDDEIEPVEFEVVSECYGTLFFYIKEVLKYEETSLHLNEGNPSVQRINNVNGYV